MIFFCICIHIQYKYIHETAGIGSNAFKRTCVRGFFSGPQFVENSAGSGVYGIRIIRVGGKKKFDRNLIIRLTNK